MAQVHKSKLIFLINDDVRVVRVTYEDIEGVPTYAHKTMDQSIEVGDYVAIKTDTRHLMTVAKVVEVDVEPDLDMTPIEWLRAKVDLADYLLVEEQELQLTTAAASAEKRALREKLRADMTIDQEAMSGLTLLSQSSDTTE